MRPGGRSTGAHNDAPQRTAGSRHSPFGRCLRYAATSVQGPTLSYSSTDDWHYMPTY